MTLNLQSILIELQRDINDNTELWEFENTIEKDFASMKTTIDCDDVSLICEWVIEADFIFVKFTFGSLELNFENLKLVNEFNRIPTIFTANITEEGYLTLNCIISLNTEEEAYGVISEPLGVLNAICEDNILDDLIKNLK